MLNAIVWYLGASIMLWAALDTWGIGAFMFVLGVVVLVGASVNAVCEAIKQSNHKG